MQNIYAGDGFKRKGEIEIEVAGLRVIHAETVDEDKGLLKAGAAHGDIGLDAGRGTLLQGERGVKAEVVDDGVVEGLRGLVAEGERENGTVLRVKRKRLCGGYCDESGGDTDCRGCLLGGEGRRGGEEGGGEESGGSDTGANENSLGVCVAAGRITRG